MKRALIFLLLISPWLSCRDKEYVNPEVQATPCESSFEDVSRKGNIIRNESAFLIGLVVYWPLSTDPSKPDFLDHTPIKPCNLSEKYRGDTAKVSVSGYYLTSPILETINISILPFELTDMKFRK